MSRLLHISASPRGAASISLGIANVFLETYALHHPDVEIDTFDLWDGSLPEFGPVATGAKMTVFGGGVPQGEQAAAWRDLEAVFQRFDAADRLLFSVPMWNAGVPYILKQFIDVVSQPGWIFGVNAETGYIPLLANKGKKAAVIYTSGVWGPGVSAAFGSDFHSTFFDDWLRWTGITDISDIRYHPTLTGDATAALHAAHERAREVAAGFGAPHQYSHAHDAVPIG
jgi:FMN-dependent NADH-azoreductase